MIFVFGSNLAGRHGKGAARYARLYEGAQYGVAEGKTGNSYALPTCGHHFEPLPYKDIAGAIYRFKTYAEMNPHNQFQVTRVACGLGGYRDGDIAPLFHSTKGNCFFDEKWKPWLRDKVSYWGTF